MPLQKVKIVNKNIQVENRTYYTLGSQSQIMGKPSAFQIPSFHSEPKNLENVIVLPSKYVLDLNHLTHLVYYSVTLWNPFPFSFWC